MFKIELIEKPLVAAVLQIITCPFGKNEHLRFDKSNKTIPSSKLESKERKK